MLVQITHLACKGFVLALSYNHTMDDAKGLSAQFLTTTGEATRGCAIAPMPWCQELLSSQNPHTTTRVRHGYNNIVGASDASDGPAGGGLSLKDKLPRSFFFSTCITLSLHCWFQSTTTAHSDFNIVVGVLWKCGAAAWEAKFADDDKVRFSFAVNVRRQFRSPGLPVGCYSNVAVVPAAVTTVGELQRWPASFVAELLRSTKMVVDGGGRGARKFIGGHNGGEG